MLHIEKRYEFRVQGRFIQYPMVAHRKLHYLWETSRNSRFLSYREKCLHAVNARSIPYFPNHLPIGMIVRVLSARGDRVDPVRVHRTMVELLRHRCWIKPRFIAVMIRWIPVVQLEDEMLHVRLSRMDV